MAIITASAANLPAISHDLQFIQGNRVMVWNHLTGQIEVKLDMNPWREGVVDPKFTYRESKIIRISGDGQSEQGEGPVDIELINLLTGEIELLEHLEVVSGEKIAGYYTFSPMGKWITYLTADWPQGSEKTPDNVTLTAVLLEPPYSKLKLSDFTGPSFGLGQGSWSPDGSTFYLSDDQGIWEINLNQHTVRLLIAQEIGTGGYVSLTSEWSPSGRYLLVYSAGAIEGGTKAVLDTQTGVVSDIEGTFSYVIPAAEPGWIAGDRLFVVYPGDWYKEKFPLMGRIWSLHPEGEAMFSLEAEFPIENVDVRFVPYSPAQLEDGRLVFAIGPNDGDMPSIPAGRWDSGLYMVSLEDLSLQRVNVLPQGRAEIVAWLPDGSGALVRSWTNGANIYLYIPSDGSPLWDLTALLGEGAWLFEWLP